MISPARRAALLGALLALAACCPAPAAPDAAPAVPLVLTPVAQTGIVDDRARFRARFCDLLGQTDPAAAAAHPCDYWLRKIGDEKQPIAAPAAPAGQPI